MRHTGVRRAAMAIGITVGLTALVAGGFDARAADPIAPGQGVASAQTAKFDPKAGGLSLGITFGQAIGAHQNSVAQATSQAINLGVIGSTLASEGCDGGEPTYPAEQQPQPLRVDSRDQGADKGKTATEYGVFDKRVRAEGTPFAEAITTTAPFSIPGLMDFGGGVSRSHSGLVKGHREAVAIVEIESIAFVGGVKLNGLRWEATYRSATSRSVAGKFSLGSATIGGQRADGPNPSAQLDAVNAALAPLGIRVAPPKAREAGGVLFVDPLAVAVVPSAQRDALAGAVLGAVQPARQELFEALLQMDCGNATYITVFDLIVGSITGAGEFAMQFGGVHASSGEIARNQFELLGAEYELGGGVAGSGPVDDSDGNGAGGAVFGEPANELVAEPSAAPDLRAAAPGVDGPPTPERGRGGRGGRLAMVGLATLALVALMAEADRRKMRRAQREIADWS